VKLPLAAAGVTAALLVGAGQAQAASTTVIGVEDAQVPTTAAGFGNHEGCGGVPARAGMDVWHFILPGNRYDFVTVIGRFADRRGTTTADFLASAPGPYGDVPEQSRSAGKHAYLYAPAGSWLIGATATITGNGRRPSEFVLSHTCPGEPASSSPGGAARPSTPAPASPSATSLSEELSISADGLGSSAGTDGDDTTGPGTGDGGLPLTGTALLGLLGAGALLIGGGVLLIAAARRRRRADNGEAARRLTRP
jgi:hypothetical protein